MSVSSLRTPAACLFLAIVPVCAMAQTAPSAEDRKINAKVDELLKKMTIEEKVGQLNQIGGLAFIPNAPKPEDAIRKSQAGSVLWISDPVAINKLQRIAVEETRLKIPLIFGLDVIHGFRTIFPMPLAMAASWDMKMIESAQAVAAKEARASGIAWTFAPMVDIARDPRWGRMIEGAGEDPYLGSAVARAQVRGFQGSDRASPDHVLACAKHFAGYGAADGGRDYDSAYIPESQMWNVYLPPFHAALEAGVGTFMSAYMDLNDVPATANPFLLKDVLRQAWNFKGFVVSDANSIGDLVTHGFAKDRSDAALLALTAGVDMDMASGTYMQNLPALVKAGKVSESLIDSRVRPILAAKFKLGLFEKPYVDEARAKQVIAAPEHHEAARAAAAKSAVLLRNEGQLLPLAKDASKSIAVIGPLADAKRDLYTMWSGFDLSPANTVTIADAIRAMLGSGARVESAPGAQLIKPIPSMFDMMFGGKKPQPWTAEQSAQEMKKAADLAARSDLVILVLGELATMDGELASQSSLDLPGNQQKLMEAVAAAGKPIALVLISGRPLDITWASEHVPAILEAWHPGSEGGNAVADLIFGDAVPAGKLPITWPRNAGQIPAYYAHNRTHVPEDSPMFKSRFWDQSSKPLYPFGYGLSYTTFGVSNIKVKESSVKVGGEVEVSVDVENTGKRASAEVVQLYIHQQSGRASRPVRELKGFQRVELGSGAKKTVTFKLGKPELSYWSSTEKKWVIDPSTFDVWAGSDSAAALHATFQLIP
jgi:beta-glucosidase